MKKYYSMYQQGKTADIHIYGDITSWEWMDSDVSSYTLSKELQELNDVDNINVYINSYGGEVSEGLAIYNALKRHKAKITTIVDGFACSIASVIFAAGDERVVSNTSLLMIHNAWCGARGNSDELRKQADDLEIINQSSINAYLNIVNIDEDAIKTMMNDETWLNGNDALPHGFATEVRGSEDKQVASQSVRQSIVDKFSVSKNLMVQIKTPKIVLDNEIKIEDFIQQFSDKVIQHIDKTVKTDPEQSEDTKQQNKPLNMMKSLFKTEGEQ